MTAVAEREGTIVRDEVMQVKEQIRKEIQQAVKAHAELILAEQLRQEFAAKRVEASEVKDEMRRFGRLPDDSRKEAVAVKATVTRVLEGIKEGVVQAPKTSQAVFSRLAEQSLSDKTASHIHTLLDKYLTQDITISVAGGQKTEFEQDLDLLRAQNPVAADLVTSALLQTAREGKLALSEADLRRRFEQRIAEEPHEAIDPRTGQSVVRPVIFTANEQRDLNQLAHKISSSKLPFEQTRSIFDELRGGIVSDTAINRLRTIGFSEPEIELLRDLTAKASKHGEHILSNPAFERYFPKEERHKFSFKFLYENNLLDDKGITERGKRLLKKTALRAVNLLFEKADSSPDREFQHSYSEFHEGYIFRDIQDVIINLMRDPNLVARYGGEESPVYREIKHFIENGLLQEVSRERELRELFHNVGIWIKMLQPKQLSEHMARYNISEVTSVAMSDVSGKLVSLAMNEYERYLQFDIAKSGGKVRPGLFAGKVNPNKLYFDEADRETLKERMIHTIQQLRGYARSSFSEEERRKLGRPEHALTRYDLDNLEDVDMQWEVDRALKYAKGLQLTQTIRGFEIIASARPPRTYEGSADNFYDMAAFINPSWKWVMGRGISGQRETHVKEMLIADSLVKQPQESLLRRIFTWGWNPKKLHHDVQAYSEFNASEKWEKIKDSWLYKDMNFRQLVNKFGLGGLGSRAGWRLAGFRGTAFDSYITGIQEAIKGRTEEVTKISFGSDWVETYRALAQVAGVGTRFWFDAGRAEAFVKTQLWQALHVDSSTKSQAELDKLWFEYTEGKHGDKVILSPTTGGEKMTVKDYLEAKTTVFQGLNFRALLNRSPIDFLNNILNLQPGLLSEGLSSGPVNIGTKEMNVKDYYFELGEKDGHPTIIDEHRLRHILEAKGMTGTTLHTEIENVLIYQRNLKRVWGEKNFKHLKEIRAFYQELEKWGKAKNLTKDQIFDALYRSLDVASERVKLRKGEKMDPSDIEDPDLRKLTFGLINYFNELNEDFGVGAKGDERFGEAGFFYHMARGWYNELGHGLHPNTSDVDWRYLLHGLGEAAGETLVKRLWGDLAAWNDVMGGLSNLDHMFMKAAHSHSMKEIIEFQQKMHMLEGISGKPAMYEMQYYFAQLVARYFQEHRAASLPFPLGTIYGLFHGKELALSKIYGGRGAMSLTTDGINAYFQQLSHLGLIAEEGQYGVARLQKALGADWSKLIIAEIIPNITIALAIFLWWKFMSEALKELEGKKK